MTPADEIYLQLPLHTWSLIPLAPGSKKPLYSWKKHQKEKLSPSDLERIYKANPYAGIAVVTGRISGLCILDVDRKSGGFQTLAELEKIHGHLPETSKVLTGSGGYHFYFSYHRSDIGNNAGTLGPGIDIRGEGGYAVCPPSIHPNGNQYKWVEGYSPDEIEIAALPAWMETLLKSPKANYQEQDKDQSKSIPEGKRHHTLVSFSGKLIKAGMEKDFTESALLSENGRRCTPPLPEYEVRHIVNDTYRRYSTGEPSQPSLNLIRPGEWMNEPEKSQEWVVEGLLPAGSLTMISSPPKVGKSTFARAAGIAVANGNEFLGRTTKKGNVIYLAVEERKDLVKRSLRDMGITDQTPFLTHFGRTGKSTIPDLETAIEQHKPVLVIIDTIGRIRKEDLQGNDYFSTNDWLEPFMYMAHETEACICLLYHDRKSGGKSRGYDALDAVLGSTGISATVDQLISPRRRNDEHRTFQTIGRFEDLDETAYILDPLTRNLRVIGDKQALRMSEREREIIDLLRNEGETSGASIRKSITGRTQETSIAIRNLKEMGIIKESGGGMAGTRFTYRINQ